MSAIPHRFRYTPDVKPLPTAAAATPLKLVMFDSAVVETSPSRTRGLPKPGAGFERLTPTPELLEELAAASNRLEKATPEEIITWGVEHYAPYLTMATAFGPEGCVI
jgi:hypothetical protein